MIKEEYEDWLQTCGHENSIQNFMQYHKKNISGKGLGEVMCFIAYAVYELEVCIDGLIQDQGD